MQHLSHSLIPSIIPEKYPRHRPVGIGAFAPRAVQHPPHLPTYPQAYPRGMWTRKRSPLHGISEEYRALTILYAADI